MCALSQRSAHPCQAGDRASWHTDTARTIAVGLVGRPRVSKRNGGPHPIRRQPPPVRSGEHSRQRWGPARLPPSLLTSGPALACCSQWLRHLGLVAPCLRSLRHERSATKLASKARTTRLTVFVFRPWPAQAPSTRAVIGRLPSHSQTRQMMGVKGNSKNRSMVWPRNVGLPNAMRLTAATLSPRRPPASLH